jgi:hypothetical protein
MSEPRDRDEAMDLLEEKRQARCGDCDMLRILVAKLRDPGCPVAHGQRITWDEHARLSADGP